MNQYIATREDHVDILGISISKINALSIIMILISWIFIGNMLYWGNGWIAVSGASFIFGSCGIPMKNKELAELNIDSMVYAVSL